MRLVEIAGFVVAAVAACGAEDDGRGSAATAPAVPITGRALPATSTTGTPVTAGAEPLRSLDPAPVTEPCPESTRFADGGGPDLAEARRLEPMLGQVLAYAGQRAAQFGSYGLVWHGAADASVFVSFTTDLEPHRSALEATVAHPDELIVCQVAISGAVAQQLRTDLVAELQGRFLSIGLGGPGIEIVVAADEETLAAELVDRYGPAVTVRVGALAYPLDTATAVCDNPPAGDTLPDLDIEIVAPSEPLTYEGVTPSQLTLSLRNLSAEPVRFLSGTATATFLDSSGRVVSSNAGISIGDAGIPVDLAPGASTELPLVASSASCDPRLGYTLPPGDYQLIAEVPRDGTILASSPRTVTVA